MQSATAARKAIIMGAAGRDFHNFNTYLRDNASYEVVAFAAAQIPFISNRTYPEAIAGKRYPNGIPIYPEDQLEDLLAEGIETFKRTVLPPKSA